MAHFWSFCKRIQKSVIVRQRITVKNIRGTLKSVNSLADLVSNVTNNNYWCKKFTSSHRHLAKVFIFWMIQKQLIPLSSRSVLCKKRLFRFQNYMLSYQHIIQPVNSVFISIYEQLGLKKEVVGCNYKFAINSNSTELGKFNHLSHMDNLKLFAYWKNQLVQILKLVQEFSIDISMQFTNALLST